MRIEVQKQEMISLSGIKARRFPIVSKRKIQTRDWLQAEEDRNVFGIIGCPNGCIWIDRECPVRCPVFLYVLLIRVKKVVMKLAREFYLRLSGDFD